MSAAATPSNSPSTFYRQHHSVEAPAVDRHEFRPHWRVKTGLDGLLAAKLITPRQWRAAVAFRAAYERAMRGAVQVGRWGAVYVDPHCRQPRPERSEAELDAAGLVRGVEAALGALYVLLVWFVVEDLAWRELADRLAVDPRSAKTWCAAAVAGFGRAVKVSVLVCGSRLACVSDAHQITPRGQSI
jgi:hypothetical protein